MAAVRQDIRHAFILSHIAASLDAMKREEVAAKGRNTAFFNRLEAMERGVNKALDKLPKTMQPAHRVSEKAVRFFDESQALLDRILGERE
jgi:hypothetical protein